MVVLRSQPDLGVGFGDDQPKRLDVLVPLARFFLVKHGQGKVAQVDELGGVDVNVPFAMNEPLSGARFAAGMNHLDGANALTNLGAFTNLGAGNLAITNAQTLSLAGDIVNLGGGNVTLTTTGPGGHVIALGGSRITTGGTVTLNSADAISQALGGIITASLLTGTSTNGAVTAMFRALGANQ